MPWPTDPERRAIALENFRAAQRARWERNDGARERLSAKATKQWSTSEARQRMSEIKRQQYMERPELRKLVSRRTREWARSDAGQKFYSNKGHAQTLDRAVTGFRRAALACVGDIVYRHKRRLSALKQARLRLIKQRMANCANGTSQSQA